MKNLKKYVQTHLKTELDIIRNSETANTLPELSLEEKAIIYKYTNDGYYVNETLRESHGEKSLPFANHLNTALSKLPSYNSVVYRGLEFTSSRLEKYRVAFKKNEPIIEHSFTSTSANRRIALQYGTLILRIFSKTGKFIENISKFGIDSPLNEREVLFTKGTQFFVLDIKDETPYFIITLEEI